MELKNEQTVSTQGNMCLWVEAAACILFEQQHGQTVSSRVALGIPAPIECNQRVSTGASQSGGPQIWRTAPDMPSMSSTFADERT